MIAKYLYCYTRTRNIDYRNIYGVSSSVCPQYVQDLFLRRLSALLNNTVDENLSSPVYVYFRHDDIVLYGIVCLNSVLSADCCLEKTNGRVRGFFGVLEQSETPIQGIPHSLDFYRQLYAQYIIPKWNSFTFHYVEDVALSPDVEAAELITPSSTNMNINTDSRYCRIFRSSRRANVLLAEALTLPGKMSVAVGITDSAQVTMDNSSLLNATYRNGDTDDYEDVGVFHVCTSCGRKVSQIFADGLCVDCLQEEQAPSPSSHPVFNDVSDTEPHPIHRCHACGEKASQLYTEKGLCGKCYKRYVDSKKRKQMILCTVICLLAVVGLAYLFPKNPLSAFFHSKEVQPIVVDSVNTSPVQTKCVKIKDSVVVDSLHHDSLPKK